MFLMFRFSTNFYWFSAIFWLLYGDNFNILGNSYFYRVPRSWGLGLDIIILACLLAGHSFPSEEVAWFDGMMEWWNDKLVEWWNGGMVELWNNGMIEWWNDGMMEWWKKGMMEWWNDGTIEGLIDGIIEWWNDGMMEWWNGGMIEWYLGSIDQCSG